MRWQQGTEVHLLPCCSAERARQLHLQIFQTTSGLTAQGLLISSKESQKCLKDWLILYDFMMFFSTDSGQGYGPERPLGKDIECNRHLVWEVKPFYLVKLHQEQEDVNFAHLPMLLLKGTPWSFGVCYRMCAAWNSGSRLSACSAPSGMLSEKEAKHMCLGWTRVPQGCSRSVGPLAKSRLSFVSVAPCGDKPLRGPKTPKTERVRDVNVRLCFHCGDDIGLRSFMGMFIVSTCKICKHNQSIDPTRHFQPV